MAIFKISDKKMEENKDTLEVGAVEETAVEETIETPAVEEVKADVPAEEVEAVREDEGGNVISPAEEGASNV